MNAKEIIQCAAKLEPTARLPATLLSGGAWALNRSGLTLQGALKEGAENTAQILAETYEKAGSDIAWAGSGYHNLAIRAIGGKIKYREKGTPDVAEPLISSPGEVEGIDLAGIGLDADIAILYETAALLTQYVGTDRLIGASQWGPFTLAGLIYSAEKVMRSIYRDKEGLKKVLEFTTELYWSYVEPYIDAGVGLISIADPSASGDMISRAQFEEFSLPYMQKLINRIKAKGAITLIHICGNITDRLDLLPRSGVDILSVDYKVNLAKVRETVGGKIAFSGNMNPVGVMLNLKPAEVEAACRNCIEQAGGGAGYILMPGCDIPPSVPIENIQAMAKVAREYDEKHAKL